MPDKNEERCVKKIATSVVVVLALLSSLLISGCYTKGEYMKKAAEADFKAKEVAALQEEKTKLTAQRDELERLLKTESSALTQNLLEFKQKNAALATENAQLLEKIDFLNKKEVEIKTESDTFKDLLKEMKGEIAQGQITITELKGKLTLDVVDKILFASGDATVKKEGLAVLKRVVDILKTVKDKAIRIEGHTDNRPIHTARYPSNWELSAARAINVTHYLEQQGIAPAILSAVAYGQYKPVANNGTTEGRAKNRRIAIVLVPKD